MAFLRGQILSPWRSPPETIGSLFANRYRIIHKVADGATGAVFCADDIGTRERVAIKLLRPELSEETGVVEFFQARIRRNTELRKSDPGALATFVDVIDIGKTAAGLVYLVMPYVVGDDLQSQLRRSGPLPWSQAQGLFVRICSALADYHRHGRVHGFLESRKCILGHDGKVMFLDDGVDALLLGAATPEMARYMSPEQASAEEVGTAADIYSLAVVFYELLTARVPFEDSSPRRTLAMHMLSPVPPLREVAPNAGIPAAVEAAILRALAKNPGDRWASMTEFSAALGALGVNTVPAMSPLLSAARQSPSMPFVPSSQPSPPSSASLGLPADRSANEPTLIGLVLPSLLGSSESSESSSSSSSSSSIAAAVAASPGVSTIATSQTETEVTASATDAASNAVLGSPTLVASQAEAVSGSATDAASNAVLGSPTLVASQAEAVSGSATGVTSEAVTSALAVVPSEARACEVQVVDGSSSDATGVASSSVGGDETSQAASGVRRRSAASSHASASGRRIIDLLPGDSSMRGRIEDNLHPSASSSMRSSANASGSRRVVNLVDVRAPGESTSEGWTPAAESNAGVRVAGVASTRSRDVAEHGAAPAADVSGENLFDSTDYLVGGEAAGGTTIRAAMLGDETLEAGSFRPGPSRSAISWVLGGVGALLAGSVALALMPSAEPPRAAPLHEAAIVAPALEPVAPEPVAPEPVAPELDASVAPAAAHALTAPVSAEVSSESTDPSTAAKSTKDSASAKTSKKSKRSKGRSQGSKKSKRARTSKAAAASLGEGAEDDVLSQVQEYMREKKAREQRAREAQHSKAQGTQSKASEKPSPADVATASERLNLARKAYKSGRFSAAYSLASQSLVAHRSVDALELMVLASCARSDGDRARQLLGKIAGARRATVEARCREAGISL